MKIFSLFIIRDKIFVQGFNGPKIHSQTFVSILCENLIFSRKNWIQFFPGSSVHFSLFPKTNIWSILFYWKEKKIFLQNSSSFQFFRFWVKLIHIFLHRIKKSLIDHFIHCWIVTSRKRINYLFGFRIVILLIP